jgi:hypothetical protein
MLPVYIYIYIYTRYQLAVVPSLIASAAVFHFYQLIEACLLAIAMLDYYLLLSKYAV